MSGTQGIRLEAETQRRLKWLAEQRDRSVNYLIKAAVDRFLEDEEQFEKERMEDEKRLRHFLDTGENVTYSDMKRKLQRLKSKAEKAVS